MRILVTGSYGFIGRHVVDALLARGDEVILSDPADEIDYICPKVAVRSNLDGIVHLGAITDTLSQDGPGLVATNIDLPKMLWNWATDYGLPFVYASSASVYGHGAYGFRETSQPDPLNAYAGSKLAFDRWAISRVGRIPPSWAGLRFFNVYGPGEETKGRMASMVSKAVWAAEHGITLNLFRHGEQRRDFVSVADVVRVVLWALDDLEDSRSGIFNVGTGRATSFAEIVEVVGPDVNWVDMPEAIRPVYQHYTCAPLARLRYAGYAEPFDLLDRGLAPYYIQAETAAV